MTDERKTEKGNVLVTTRSSLSCRSTESVRLYILKENTGTSVQLKSVFEEVCPVVTVNLLSLSLGMKNHSEALN